MYQLPGMYGGKLFLFCGIFLLLSGGLCHHAGQSQQGNEVGEHHQAVKEVGKVPNQLHLEEGAEDDKQHHNHGVDFGRLLAEQGFDVDFAKEVPPDDG